MSRLTQVAVFAVALLFVPVAQSAVVTWELQGVTFADGGTASGFFTLDDSAVGFIRDYEIQTTDSGGFPGQLYNMANLTGLVSDIVHFHQLHFTNPTSHLAITFEQDQFFDPGTTTVRVPPLGQVVPTHLTNAQNYEYLYATTQGLRYISGGNAVAIAVPEPSTFLSLGIGVAALLLAAIRGRRPM